MEKVILKILYQVGQSGKTSEKAIITENNPFLKIITQSLDKLKIVQHFSLVLISIYIQIIQPFLQPF